MIKQHNARAYRMRRKRRVRARIHGTAARQRLSVFRSSKHIYAQIIDDEQGHTLVAASSLEPQRAECGVGGASRRRGERGTQGAGGAGRGPLVGERASAAGITKIAFDRGGFVYHGRVKALADGARAAGLDF